MKPLSDQLACARRELALRRSVYPKWIDSGRLSRDKAAHEIECMESIVASIEKLKHLEEVTEEMRPFE